MSVPAKIAHPTLPALFALFRPVNQLPEYEVVPASGVPQPYHRLLVHKHHMTVTVEAHHGDLVNVRVLERRHQGDMYARKILLALQGSGRVVQFGIARINLAYCSPAVRQAILAADTPLGRVLIQHRVLRRIEPTDYLRVVTGPAMMKWFNLDRPRTTYGRLGIIYCDNQPAVEVLEIVAPERDS
jgi:chorismate-pyruvate lyase